MENSASRPGQLSLLWTPEDAPRHGRGRWHPCWHVTSLRTGRRFAVDKQREHDALVVLDVDPTIADFRHRPVRVQFWHEGVLREISPHLLIDRSGRRTLCRFVEDPNRVDARLQANLAEQLAMSGYGLSVLEWRDVLRESALEIAVLIRHHAVRTVSITEREAVRRALSNHRTALWTEVIRSSDPPLSAGIVCRLLFEGALRLAPSGRLRPHTRIELNQPRPPGDSYHGDL